ncbi:MAG TPA: flagellar motor protein MotB [Syntrophorhabdaceae bacterium]|nr:flagellar motor protein MotB [Syntrophorhabdaceae bacterium]HQH42310.1 flagellar motor protein MotB [Syntrophorhabdaceae bacterium]HQK45541.1 flagellar motor protein MotB [Syntrophorhabdaceae bacterium]
MSDDKHNIPIRIVVKKKGHAGHHGGAWKVAYSDFVTAMMALFIVLWIVSQNNSIKQAIAAYFKDPTIFIGGSGIHSGVSSAPPKPVLFPMEDPKASDQAFKAFQDEISKIKNEMEKLKAEGKKIENIVASTPGFEKFKDKIQLSVTEEGLKIELIENSQGLFFDVGSARVKPETVKLLKMIAQEIAQFPNQVIIEGHTDALPYISPGYSNWELSADRANAARKILEENGVKKEQIIGVRGYADRQLKHPDRPMDFANRRVNIIIAIPKPKIIVGQK